MEKYKILRLDSCSVYQVTILLVFLLLTAGSLVTSKDLPNGIHLGKLFYFYGSILLSGVLFLIIILKEQLKPMPFNWLDCLVLLSIAYTIFRVKPADKVFWCDDDFLVSCCLVPTYVIYKWLTQNPSSSKVSAVILICIGSIQALMGIAQKLHVINSHNPYFSVVGFYNNPNTFAMYLVAILPFAIVPLFASRSVRGMMFLYTITTTIMVLGIIMSESRTVIVITAIIVFILVFEKLKKVNIFVKNNVSLILFVLLFGILFSAYHISILNISSLRGRLLIWKITTNMISENFIFGVGKGQYHVEYLNYQAEYFDTKDLNELSSQYIYLADDSKFAFNEFLEVFAELGLIGILMYGGVIVFAILIILERNRRDILVRSAGFLILAIALSGTMSYPLSILHILLLLLFAFAILSSSLTNRVFHIDKTVNLSLITISLVCSAYSAPYQVNRYKSLKKIKAFSSIVYMFPEEGVELYKKFYDKLKYDSYYLSDFSNKLLFAQKYYQCIEVLNRTQLFLNNHKINEMLGKCYKAINDFERAEVEFITAINKVPNRFSPRYELMKLYIEENNIERAVETAYQIIKLNEKVPSKLTMQAKKEAINLVKEFQSIDRTR